MNKSWRLSSVINPLSGINPNFVKLSANHAGISEKPFKKIDNLRVILNSHWARCAFSANPHAGRSPKRLRAHNSGSLRPTTVSTGCFTPYSEQIFTRLCYDSSGRLWRTRSLSVADIWLELVEIFWKMCCWLDKKCMPQRASFFLSPPSCMVREFFANCFILTKCEQDHTSRNFMTLNQL